MPAVDAPTIAPTDADRTSVDIALVTGTDDTGIEGFAAFVEQVDGPLAAALRRRDVTVHQPVWSDPEVDWSRYDLALVRTTWDYPDRREEFLAWADRAAAATTLLNPPDVLRWNSHKSYLLELEDRGAPVVPTAWLGRGGRIDLVALLAARGWSRAVVKPAVGSGGRGMVRVATDPSGDPDVDAAAPAGPDPSVPGLSLGVPSVDRPSGEVGPAAGQRHLDDLLAVGDVLVQPYLPSVTSRGERSAIVVAGEVTHVVRKLPPEGEYRVHDHRGGRYHVEPPDPEVTALARWVVESTGTDLFVARVDLLEDELGTLQLAELEATEPDLYLYVDGVGDAADRLADGLVARATAR